LHGHIRADRASHGDLDLLAGGAFEAGQFDIDAVVAGKKVEELIGALGVRQRLPALFRSDVG